MKLLRLFLFCAFIALNASASAAGDNAGAVGLWKNDKATFELYENDGKLFGKIASLKQPNTPAGKPKTDIHNPDPSKHGDPIIGLIFLRNFSPAGSGRWEHGTIYDPKTGKTYSSNMELEGTGTMKVRGFIGVSLIGRTEVWTRAQ